MSLQDVLGFLSEQSGCDENLLSSRERELLTNILRRAKACDSSATSTIESILAHAVGETLIQRAAAAAGRSVMKDIEARLSDAPNFDPTAAGKIFLNSPPPPATGPRPPSPSGPGPGPGARLTQPVNEGGVERRIFLNSPPPPATGPRPPSPSGPGPGPGRSAFLPSNPGTAVVAEQERGELLRAQCVVLDEFLAPQELRELSQFTSEQEANFQVSEVISPGVTGGVIDPEYRRSRVLMELGKHEDVFRQRIQSALPRVLEKLEMDTFPVTRFEAQITASNHGDFFHHHSDNAEEEIARRRLTFVYFFHREPKMFEGGELRLHDAYRKNGGWVSTGRHQTVMPEQNQIVFFPSSLLHEITPVICPSQAFADSRFTVNGWLHQ